MTNSSAPYIIHKGTISSEHSDTKWHFSHTPIRRKLTLFETCFCLRNTLSWDLGTGAFRLRWSYRWNHELNVKNLNQTNIMDTKPICFNPFTQRYKTSRRGRGMVAPNCLHGRRDSPRLGDRKCIYHFTPLAQRSVNNWLSLAKCQFIPRDKQQPVE